MYIATMHCDFEKKSRNTGAINAPANPAITVIPDSVSATKCLHKLSCPWDTSKFADPTNVSLARKSNHASNILPHTATNIPDAIISDWPITGVMRQEASAASSGGRAGVARQQTAHLICEEAIILQALSTLIEAINSIYSSSVANPVTKVNLSFSSLNWMMTSWRYDVARDRTLSIEISSEETKLIYENFKLTRNSKGMSLFLANFKHEYRVHVNFILI